MVVLQGDNGQGKSNLLEAIYMLAIAKSHRTNSERELIYQHRGNKEQYAQVTGIVKQNCEELKLRIDYQSIPDLENNRKTNIDQENINMFRKGIRLDGRPIKASNLIGQVPVVLFSPEDLGLIYGSPSIRRRYLDILISQLDRNYLKTLQRYQKVLYQRNHLLKSIRSGRSDSQELGFWDEELIREGSYIITTRFHTTRTLSKLANPIHFELAGGNEQLNLVYIPTFENTGNNMSQSFQIALDAKKDIELKQGVTLCGPHRDDLQIQIDSMNANAFASRGQSRTAVLAMRLAEARHIHETGRKEPIILLDDVLSELDSKRRSYVLQKSVNYEQCIITTPDFQYIDTNLQSHMTPMAIRDSTIKPVDFTHDTNNK